VNRRGFWIPILATLLLLAVAPLAAQQEPAEPPAGDEGGLAAATVIDEILEGEELLLSETGYTYDPGNRRDPFRSLIAGTRRVPTGPRPEGVAGMLIDEVILSGIFQTSQGFVAQVQSSERGKSYLIREGDQLLDGDVIAIVRGEVVFKQIVSDPTVIKPFREVVKKLNP